MPARTSKTMRLDINPKRSYLQVKDKTLQRETEIRRQILDAELSAGVLFTVTVAAEKLIWTVQQFRSLQCSLQKTMFFPTGLFMINYY